MSNQTAAAETEAADNATPETPSSDTDTFDLAISKCREFNNLLYYEKNVTVRLLHVYLLIIHLTGYLSV